MAFTNFYLIAGGSGAADINAGSSTGAARATTTNGNWSAVTGVFVAASGTPFSTTVVGDYASVYIDNATVAVFVAKVTTVTSSTNITIDITTIKYGTAPTTSATARSCTINGAWATEQVLAAGGLASTTVPQSTKINIKGNLTITASRTISMAGSTTAPLWFSGYNTNPNDLDADTTNTLAKPIWTFNSPFSFVTSGAHQTWSGLSVTGTLSNVLWTVTGNPGQTMLRCRVENTSSNAAAVTILTNGATQKYVASYFKCPSTATTTGVVQSGSTTCIFLGCVFDTGGIAGFNAGSNNNNSLIQCVFLNNVGSGILASTGTTHIIDCTFYGATVNGVKWTGTPSNQCSVIGCLFSGLNSSTATTNGINNASGTNTNLIARACNDYYNVTNTEVGLGDSPAFFPQTDSNPVVTSATNMTPVPGASARKNGFPGIFENETFSTFLDIGAVQSPKETSACFA